MARFSPRAFACFTATFVLSADALSARIGYNASIQPILAENCFHCHGPDSASRKGKLRLDGAAFATQPRENGDRDPAIVPGKPAASLVIERLRSKDPEEVMPPPETHKQLKPEEVALLEQWIAEGAQYEAHWALIAPQRPAVPTAGAAWARNPIDAFVAARLEAEKLRPAGPEKPERLLRRVTHDLTGLPPTPEDLAAFVRDPSPAAFERAVERLLASDACAEHFARHWLDAVRYADTHGIHIDNYRSIWPYRDWVVDAFRRNLPFDQFTLEQMAGDLLPGATLEQRVASGYNRCLSTTSEGGAINEEYEAIYAKDRVDTLGSVWMGLTTGCASCHDHKFDPISTRDFYSLAAFFRNNTMPAMDGNRYDTPPTLFVPATADRAAWPRVERSLADLKAELTARERAGGEAFERWVAQATQLTPPPRDHTLRHYVSLQGSAPADGPLSASDDVQGPYGRAVRIDGAPRDVAPAVALRRETSVSFSLMVRVEGQPDGPLLSCRDPGEAAPGWDVFLETGKIGLRITDGTGVVAVRNVGGALTPGQWHHVMLSFDPGAWRSRTIEVFLDGKSTVNSGISTFLPVDITPAAPLRLGAAADGQGGVTLLTSGKVWVQDLRVQNRGFLATEVKELSDEVEAYRALLAPPAKRSEAQRKVLREHFFAAEDEVSRTILARLDPVRREEAGIRERGGLSLVMEERKDSQPFAHILNRGEYSQPGEKVPAGTPAALPPMAADAPRNRLGLAKWLTAPENPLTARVTVNRLWQQFFGTGLVESAGDFGVTGSRPSHPDLLDWLAVEFRESGWDYRRMARLMVTSATYRQSAVVTPALLERDPANRLLARGPRYRLDAEQLRDQALAASGLLVAKLGGRPARPYQPEGIWEDVAMKESTTRFYRVDFGENLYRRSLYTLWKRTAPPPAMDLLNAPSREVSCVRRDRTNTPLQALVTLNDPLFVEASRQLAFRSLASAADFDLRLDAISLRLTGRRFEREERAVVRGTLDSALRSYRRDPAAAEKLIRVGQSPVPAGADPAELAAWTLVASQVMNLDEALTK
jgi:mono/diheme cytochrome c family protein